MRKTEGAGIRSQPILGRHSRGLSCLDAREAGRGIVGEDATYFYVKVKSLQTHDKSI